MRQQLTDSAQWFDTAKAAKIQEGTTWDGRNRISLATGSQWDHEALYYTKSGRWVLNSWSQWAGSIESYEEVSEDFACDWLIKNGMLDVADWNIGDVPLPDSVIDWLEGAMEGREI